MNKLSDPDNVVRSAKVRELNDAFRTTLTGGTVVMTEGIVALGADAQTEVLAAVQAFKDFTPSNDPWKEHDFGELTVLGWRVYFQLDYYDLTRAFYSPEPADPDVTERVMTIMLASEY